jgi:hypothetical protein
MRRHAAEASWLGRGPCAIGVANTLEEGITFHFDTVHLATAGGTGAAGAHGQIEQQRDIGLEGQRGPALQYLDALHGLAAATTLVRKAGIGKPVAKHPAAGGQRRLDHLAHQLGARGEHQQQLSLRTQFVICRVEHHATHRLAYSCTTGFAGDDQIHALRTQMLLESTQ